MGEAVNCGIIPSMEKITTDIYSFENLRQGGYVYVDKTDLLWRLAADQDGRQFFISRPRRFGKSLMLSTLKCIFEGKRKLFAGHVTRTWKGVVGNKSANLTAFGPAEVK